MTFGSIIPLPTSAIQFVTSILVSGSPTSQSRTGYTVVDKYGIGAIQATGSIITLRVQSTATVTLNNVYIGQVATSGNLYDFDGGQIAVTWNTGSASLAMVASATYTSDEITFTIDDSKAILIAYNVGTGSIARTSGLIPSTDYISYERSAVQQAADTVKSTGYTATSGRSQITQLVQVAG